MVKKYVKKKLPRKGYSYTKNGKRIKVPPGKQRYKVRNPALKKRISLERAKKIHEQRSQRAQTIDEKTTSKNVLEYPTEEWAAFSNRMDVEGVDTALKKIPKEDIGKTLKKVESDKVHDDLKDLYEEFKTINNLLYSAEHLSEDQIKKLKDRRDEILVIQYPELKYEAEANTFEFEGSEITIIPRADDTYAYSAEFAGYHAYKDGLSYREKEKWRKCARWDSSSKTWKIYENKKEKALKLLHDAGLIDEVPESKTLREQYLSKEELSDTHAVIEIGTNERVARIDADEETLKKLDKLYSYHAKGYRFSRAYKSGKWDGKIHLIGKDGTLPKGLAYNILSNKELEDTNVKVVDFRPSAVRRKPMELKDITLYDFQEEAVRNAIDNQHGLIISATGSGKTEMGAGIIAEYGEDNDSVFLVHTSALQDQAEKRLEKRLGKDVGTGGGARHAILKTKGGDTNVITVQTLHNAIEKKKEGKKLSKKEKETLEAYKDAEVIIHDEAHHVKAETFKENLDEANTKHVYGLTATPYRDENDELEVYSRLGSEITNITPDELIEKGRLVPPEINVVDVPAREEARKASIEHEGTKGSERYNAVREEQVFNNPHRNEMIKELAEKQENRSKTTLIFVDRIEHGERLSEMLGTPFLNGQDSSKKARARNDKVLNDIKKGKQKTLVATQQLFGEGFDMPAIDSLIIASGGKSKVATMQKAGRALRTKKGKKSCEIYEFRDNVPYLKDHADERIHTYRQHEKFKINELKPEDL
ncbi:MAG: DEAD/DEAH box helicase [bacterium]